MGCCFSFCYETKKQERSPTSSGYKPIDSQIYRETEIINKKTKSPGSSSKSPQQAALKKSPQQQQLSAKKQPNLSPVRVSTWKDVDENRRSYQNNDADRLEEETNLYFSAMETPLVKRSTSSENLFNLNASLKRLRHNNKTSLFEINTISQKIAYRGPLVSKKDKSPSKKAIAPNNIHEVTIDLNGLNIKDATQVVNSSMAFYSNRKINKLDHLTKKVVISYILEKDSSDRSLLSPTNVNRVTPNTEHKSITPPPRNGSTSIKRTLSNSSLSTAATKLSATSEYRNLGYQLFDYLVDKGVEECELVNTGLLKVGVTPRR